MKKFSKIRSCRERAELVRNRLWISAAILLGCSIASWPVYAQREALKQRIQIKMVFFRSVGIFPGLSIGIVLPDNTVWAFTSGWADSVRHIPKRVNSYMEQGSVGKTYVSAIMMQLNHDKKIGLDDKISKYLDHYPWFSRLPNARDVTIRMLMNHTSGNMRYEFKDAFTKDLSNNRDKVRKPEEELAYVFDEKAAFKAGEGWDYADTNYIVLAMIMEQVSNQRYYDMLDKLLLKPLGLVETRPSDQRKLKGLVLGYAGAGNEFGGRSEVIGDDGKMIINPQFEWTGGGIYSTTRDLAKWGKILYEGKAFDPSMLPIMEDGVEAKKLGVNTYYGLGVIIRQSTKYGVFYGHSGFFPGYMTELCYFPKYKMAFAVQTNLSDYKNMNVWPLKVLIEIAKLAFSDPASTDKKAGRFK